VKAVISNLLRLAKKGQSDQNSFMTHSYTWLFWDADGTLFDYDLAEAAALEGTFRYLDLHFSPAYAEAYREINHQVWVDFENGRISSAALRVRRFELLFEAVKIQGDASTFSQHYLLHLSQQAQLIEGAEALIQQLAGEFRLALITNGLSDVQRPRLALSPFANRFDEVAISEELGAAKPDPAYFEEVFRRIGAHFETPRRDQVLVIGDSLSSDIQGGINFGLDTCWFNPHAKPPHPTLSPHYEIRRLAELLNLLQSAGLTHK
jgi:2-haloacid dehalogenase